ncbi:MAG: LicD family protein [Eubacteriales bacterium]|jgi:lipopolysaccharide cholinephosphotransferase
MVKLKVHIPDEFYKEEVRCGYTVTEEAKKLWAVQLDLLAELDRVCRKYDIKYCADGGTLLGAVRHHGFIPWDNDMDIAMLRSEFEKLNKVAPSEFKSPYFWQTEETDPGSARGHAQLRNSDTTGILPLEYEHQRNNNFNQGIFIDIFPFDTVTDDQDRFNEQNRNRLKLNAEYKAILNSVNYFCFRPWRDESGKLHTELRKLANHFRYKLSGTDYLSVYHSFIDEIKRYDSTENTRFVANLSLPIPVNQTLRNREDFDELQYTDFEFMQIPVFIHYDRNLKRMYGDNYMTPIRSDSVHGSLIADTEKPYTWYLAQRK